MIEDLVNRAKNGDDHAEDDLFYYLLVRLKAFATHRIGEEDSGDIAIEACEIILKKYKDIDFNIGFEAWAYGVLKKVLHNYYRRRMTENRVIVGDPEVETRAGNSSISNPELRIALMDCLKKILLIYPRYAAVLNMVYEGYLTVEICKELEVKPNNYYVILNRGRAVLKRCLETGKV